MPAHDWSRVNDGIFHDFHCTWIVEIKRALLRGLLPKGYYVLAEQKGGDIGAPDVLTLQSRTLKSDTEDFLSGTSALATMPPDVHTRTSISRDVYALMQRSLVIRHTSDDRIVAMIEVISRGNKSNRHAMRSFLDKALAALDSGIHLLLIDVHAPGPRDPEGIHGVILNEIGTVEYHLETPGLLTTAAYVSGPVVEAFVDHFAVGEPIPKMPLFLTNDHYVSIPLEPTYMAAWEDVPIQYREALTRQ